MKPIPFAVAILFALNGCNNASTPTKPFVVEQPSTSLVVPTVPTVAVAPKPKKPISLAKMREGFKTKLTAKPSAKVAVATPPTNVLRTVKYDAPVGKLAAYLSLDPKDGKKHPAMIWITGGDCNSIDEGCWQEGPPNNEQSASAYRKAGMIVMFPSLRGGNDNPGTKESFLGEVDDVIAAHEYLSKQDFVDPNRIYLGGHSTGGTLALLVAECSDRFRAVFSFGPAHDVCGYDPKFLTFNSRNMTEIIMRSPGTWIASIKTPTFVIEGDDEGNMESLEFMAKQPTNPNAHFLTIHGGNHTNILATTNRTIAGKISRDTGPTCNITITDDEVKNSYAK